MVNVLTVAEGWPGFVPALVRERARTPRLLFTAPDAAQWMWRYTLAKADRIAQDHYYDTGTKSVLVTNWLSWRDGSVLQALMDDYLHVGFELWTQNAVYDPVREPLAHELGYQIFYV